MIKKKIVTNLSTRLQCICDMVKSCDSVVDVGTDHAYVPIELIGQGRVRYALATDVREKPVRRADGNIKRYCMTDRIKTMVTEGLKGIDADKFNVLIIAGMGGKAITGILKEGYVQAVKFNSLILQPMRDIALCRRWLSEHGFIFNAEKIVKDSGHIYTVMSVEPGGGAVYDDEDILIGPYLKKGTDRLYEEYIDMLLIKRRRMAEGLSAVKRDMRERDGVDLAELRMDIIREIDILEKNCCLNKNLSGKE